MINTRGKDVRWTKLDSGLNSEHMRAAITITKFMYPPRSGCALFLEGKLQAIEPGRTRFNKIMEHGAND